MKHNRGANAFDNNKIGFLLAIVASIGITILFGMVPGIITGFVLGGCAYIDGSQ